MYKRQGRDDEIITEVFISIFGYQQLAFEWIVILKNKHPLLSRLTLQTVAEESKTDRILRSSAIADKESFEVENKDDKCNKDTTGLVTMNTFSRGHLFFVSSGGFIRYYAPLYKSEGTAQVAIHTIKYLELYVREYENIDDAFLFYDNMVWLLISFRNLH